jgi:ATP-dependent RNA helicase TDRD9
MHGRVYRLVSKWFYSKHMEEQSMPEILRCPLENVVLKAKILDMGPPQGILALAMDPPNLSDITNTILILKEVGALLRTCNGKLTSTDGDLTFIGRVMAALPLDIRISRMVIFGYIFSLLGDCIIIGRFRKKLIIFQIKNVYDFFFYSRRFKCTKHFFVSF